MLNAIRTRQPISRADLARLTGLQRSTVSLIVEQLARERWIVEGGFAHLPRGRKPRLLSLDIERAGIIGVNIRPRVTTVALSDLNGDFDSQESFPTPKSPEGLVRALVGLIDRLVGMHSKKTFEGVGISVPGRVDRMSGTLVFAPNLGWRDVDLKGPLEKATKIPVLVENAANACALAETWSGPFAGVQDLIAVTVSEGIGTGIIANGQLVRGPGGAAGEFGHASIDPSGPSCNCGSRGCWEVFASNAAAVRAYNEDLPVGSPLSRHRKAHAQASVEDFKDLLSLAERGDIKACQVLEQMGQYLGYGLAMLINGLAPSVITIVGEVTRAWEMVGPFVQKVIEERSLTHSVTRIVPTDEVMQPRLRGTVALVLQRHFQPNMFP